MISGGALFISRNIDYPQSRYIYADGMIDVYDSVAEFSPLTALQVLEYIEAHLLMFEWWELVE